MSCAICLELLSLPTLNLQCGHSFDYECLKLLQENRCPLCRQYTIPFENKIYLTPLAAGIGESTLATRRSRRQRRRDRIRASQ
jgi:hypothetical protein